MLESFFIGGLIEAGCDEAGRGCLAGPVFAGAVILPPDYHHKLINDSKLLSQKQRELLRIEIEKEAITWATGIASVEEIDQINILNASILAMHRALINLKVTPQHLIIDGNRFRKYENIPHTCIVKGDCKYLSIAASSILAKTYRDSFMCSIALKYPEYGWTHNKGYATIKHKEAIRKYGQNSWHRKTFQF